MLRDLLRRYRTNEGQIGGRSHGRLTVVYSSIIYCPHMNLISTLPGLILASLVQDSKPDERCLTRPTL
jgi:hypothetical protein